MNSKNNWVNGADLISALLPVYEQVCLSVYR
jgi:hypothetical protein